MCSFMVVFFFKEKTAYEMRISDWSSDLCSSDLDEAPKTASLSDRLAQRLSAHRTAALQIEVARHPHIALAALVHGMVQAVLQPNAYGDGLPLGVTLKVQDRLEGFAPDVSESPAARSEEHTSELQSLMRTSY